jgi:hypothetical protein
MCYLENIIRLECWGRKMDGRRSKVRMSTTHSGVMNMDEIGFSSSMVSIRIIIREVFLTKKLLFVDF